MQGRSGPPPQKPQKVLHSPLNDVHLLPAWSRSPDTLWLSPQVHCLSTLGSGPPVRVRLQGDPSERPSLTSWSFVFLPTGSYPFCAALEPH